MIAPRVVIVVLGAIPFVTAAGQWATFAIFGLDDHRNVSRAIDLVVIGLGLAMAGVVAQRSGARWWTPAWVVGAAAAGFFYFFAMAIALLAFAPDDGTGCPGGRIYC